MLPAAAFVVPRAERNIEELFGNWEGHVSVSFDSSEMSLGDSEGSLRRVYADTEEKAGCDRIVERMLEPYSSLEPYLRPVEG